MALTKATYSMIDGAPVNVLDYGAVGDGVTDDTAAIQAAIDSGAGTVFYPSGTYSVTSALILASDMNHVGQGEKSVLKVGAASGFHIFYATSNISNITIENLKFDGSLNYPANSTTYKQTYTLNNGAIATSGGTVTNITVRNCHFYKMSYGSIDFNGDASADIRITDNIFDYGSYVFKAISVRIPAGSPGSDSVRVRRVLVSGNQINICGPQYHYDPSKEDWIASADGIHIDSAMDCVISDNQVYYSGSIGIRVEDSIRVNVTGNIVAESGQDGIVLYKSTVGCNVTGNTVKSWGRTPFAYAMRSYSGSYYYAKEFPDASTAPLPADPSASSWWAVWPYSTTNVNLANVIAYDNTDYYVGVNDGILPFRGNSAVGCFSTSTNNNFTSNNCFGNLALDGSSKRLYASNFGWSNVHPVNSPAESGNLCVVTAHQTVDPWDYRLYSPANTDPINAPASGNLKTSIVRFVGCRDTSSVINETNEVINDTSSTFTATINVAGGSVTQNYSKLRYSKKGREVTIVGEINLSAISTPTGAVTVTGLPYANRTNTSGTRDARQFFFVGATGLTGVTSGFVTGFLESNATSIKVEFYEAGSYTDLGTKLTATTSFRFSFTYLTYA